MCAHMICAGTLQPLRAQRAFVFVASEMSPDSMNSSSSMILVPRKCGSAFSGVLSILFLRRDHSPCRKKPRTLTGAARKQDARDAPLALSDPEARGIL